MRIKLPKDFESWVFRIAAILALVGLAAAMSLIVLIAVVEWSDRFGKSDAKTCKFYRDYMECEFQPVKDDLYGMARKV